MTPLQITSAAIFGAAMIVSGVIALIVIRKEIRHQIGQAKLRRFAKQRPRPPLAKYEEDDMQD